MVLLFHGVGWGFYRTGAGSRTPVACRAFAQTAAIRCENHTTAILLLKEVFAIDIADLDYSKTDRIDKQYYVTSAPFRDEMVECIRMAESFNAELLNVVDRLKTKRSNYSGRTLKSLI